jgi:hypothetical protein
VDGTRPRAEQNPAVSGRYSAHAPDLHRSGRVPGRTRARQSSTRRLGHEWATGSCRPTRTMRPSTSGRSRPRPATRSWKSSAPQAQRQPGCAHGRGTPRKPPPYARGRIRSREHGGGLQGSPPLPCAPAKRRGGPNGRLGQCFGMTPERVRQDSGDCCDPRGQSPSPSACPSGRESPADRRVCGISSLLETSLLEVRSAWERASSHR